MALIAPFKKCLIFDGVSSVIMLADLLMSSWLGRRKIMFVKCVFLHFACFLLNKKLFVLRTPSYKKSSSDCLFLTIGGVYS